MAYRVTNVDGLIELMRDLQGDQPSKDFAESLAISPQYLCDIYRKRKKPGPKVLAALRASRTVAYSYPDDIAKEIPHGRKR